jgi:hypothetical protein
VPGGVADGVAAMCRRQPLVDDHRRMRQPYQERPLARAEVGSAL